MKFFIAALLMLLGVLDLAQAQCKPYSIRPDIEKLCNDGEIKNSRKFPDSENSYNYLQCVDNILESLKCVDESISQQYFNPITNNCDKNSIDSISIGSICSKDSKDKLLPYIDTYKLNSLKKEGLSPPIFQYFVVCGDDITNPELKVCYGEGLECVFKDGKCEEKK